MERDQHKWEHERSYDDFNSHAHVERDIIFVSIAVFWRISTHTLTWSVTVGALFNEKEWEFQLTRSRGA